MFGAGGELERELNSLRFALEGSATSAVHPSVSAFCIQRRYRKILPSCLHFALDEDTASVTPPYLCIPHSRRISLPFRVPHMFGLVSRYVFGSDIDP